MVPQAFTYDNKCATDLGLINFYGSFSLSLSPIMQNSILLSNIDMLGPAFSVAATLTNFSLNKMAAIL